MTIVIVGTVALAIIHDPSGTANLITIALSVRGVTWITKKVTENINRDASQIIDFAGWSIAGVSMVKIISNAIGSVNDVKAIFISISDGFTKVAEVLDKITFWN